MKHRRLLFGAAALFLAGAVLAPVASAGDRLARSDRREINRLLDRFVPAAVRRQDPLSASRMVAPELRASTSHAEWKRGDIPVYPYPAKGTRFHNWTLSYKEPREVGISLFLLPRREARKRTGPIAFDVTLKKIDGRWLISSFIPGAVYAPEGSNPRINAPVDVGPGGAGEGQPVGPGRLGAVWLIVPFGLLGLAVLVALGFPVVRWQRDRRAVRQL